MTEMTISFQNRGAFAKEDTVLICPEVLGGLPTPRPSAEIIGGNGDDVLDGKAKVMTKDGEDVTEAFVSGAYKALEQIKIYTQNILF